MPDLQAIYSKTPRCLVHLLFQSPCDLWGAEASERSCRRCVRKQGPRVDPGGGHQVRAAHEVAGLGYDSRCDIRVGTNEGIAFGVLEAERSVRGEAGTQPDLERRPAHCLERFAQGELKADRTLKPHREERQQWFVLGVLRASERSTGVRRVNSNL